MRYDRMFHFSSSHLNSQHAYDLLWMVRAKGPASLNRVELHELLSSIHGHNFRVHVVIEGNMAMQTDWLLDDTKLTDVVMAWSNINLSVHEDFLEVQQRATTEAMAEKLWIKISDLLKNQLKLDIQKLIVTVWETDDISAMVCC